MAYAITNTKEQGMELDEKVILHEVDKMIGVDGDKPQRILYTAITRTKKYDNLFIAN